MPVLSIIIPVYNTEKFLSRCIESIIGQTFCDWELILVNDGSKDNSLDICYQYQRRDSRIKVIDKKNEGSGPARNAGIEAANGKYLAFPDSDDRMELNAYKVCVQKMEETDADILVFGMKTEVYNNETDEVENVVQDSIPNLYIQSQKDFRNRWTELYRKMDLGSPCNKIYRRALIEKYKIQYPALRRMQDGVFNMYYFNYVQSFVSINENFFIRTWHSMKFQRKKMPKDFIECAITHHKTMTSMLKEWDRLDKESILFFGERFSETILTAEFNYLPSEFPSLRELYQHIRAINNNLFIHDFYRELKKYKRLRKREIAMANRWNLLLAIETYMKARKR